jgi:hypothetical protein
MQIRPESHFGESTESNSKLQTKTDQFMSEDELETVRDLESAEQDIIQTPAPCLHPRLENLHNVRRWPTYPLDRSNISVQPQVSPIANTFTPFTAATIPEDPVERTATPATVSHFVPATYPRDLQGFPRQKP